MVTGTHADPHTIDAAIQGARQSSGSYLQNSTPTTASTTTAFTGPGSDAIRRHRVPRVVTVSSLGREVALNKGLVAAAYASDGLMQGSGAHVRSLSMPAFMEDMSLQLENLRDGHFVGCQTANRAVPSVATTDIAGVASRWLLDDVWTGQATNPVLGPEDLSFDDMADIMTETLGRAVRYQQLSPEDYQNKLMKQGMSAAWATALAENQMEASRGTYNADARTTENTGGISFSDWCRTELAPAFRG